jgi:hypothetical protein
MPDDLREAVSVSGSGYYTTCGHLMNGPDAYHLRAYTRPGGIELEIMRPDGSACWKAVIV